MAHDAPTYDLMLLLSTAAADDERAKILADVQSAITAGGGAVTRGDQWAHARSPTGSITKPRPSITSCR